jgi:serine/threonine protein phosphatase PrpC
MRWGERVYVANAGDCRAVVCREPFRALGLTEEDKKKSAWVALSADHCADLNESERARVVAAAGPEALRRVNGVWRVGPAGLAVTRAIGDGDCKPFGVVATPEVVEYAVDVSYDAKNGGDDFALILACDGVWDVVSNADARDLVLDTVKEPSMSAKRLGSEALARGSTDNVTAVVVFLKQTDTAETVTWERAF